MKKKLLAMVLALAMLCTLALPAFASDAADARLTAVVTAVKKTLGLNTDFYTAFYGDVDDNPLAPTWRLAWSNDDGESLNVEAMEDGKILYYSYYPAAASGTGASGLPHFPAGDPETAKAAAEAFVNKVLTQGETAAFDAFSGGRLNATEYSFWGEILINGVSADLSFSVTVRCADNVVTSFHRDESSMILVEPYPAADAAVQASKAAESLRTTLEMKLEYVMPEGDANMAVLRYLPVYGDSYYVDAKTGELVNLSEIYRKVGDGDFSDAGNDENMPFAPNEPEVDSSLTPVEQEGIAKLEGVMSREALDAAIRKNTALGLDTYTLGTADYSVERDTPEGETAAVTAYLRYGKQIGSYTLSRNVMADARTGEILQVSSYGSLPAGTDRPITFEAAQEKATAFLKAQNPEAFARAELYASTPMDPEHYYDWTHSFTWAEKQNGYFYAGNTLSVTIDATDGSIADYHPDFDLSVTFDSPEGICTMDKAIDAWLGTYDVPLHYVFVPTALDFSKPPYDALAAWGIPYLYRAVLGYSLEQETNIMGVDAKTGEAVYYTGYDQDTKMVYDDLAGHWAKAQIEKLAAFNIGFKGGKFQPDKALTQVDLINLVLTVRGYSYDLEEEDAVDQMYQVAYQLGLLTKEERDDDASVTRTQAVKMILDALGYGTIAQLPGIYKTGFADESQIPAELVGYVALAKGLGIVAGTDSNQFLPTKGCTRAELAVMLFNLLSK